MISLAWMFLFVNCFEAGMNLKLPATEDLAKTQERYNERLRKHGPKFRKNLKLQRIKHARRRNATCMDGTDAHYYLSRQINSTDWIIHLQSGGSCISKSECKHRANGPLGSSILLDYQITGEWTLSDDPNINPTFHAWNKVLIPYCSGDVFVGRQTKNNHPYRLPQLGHFILVAVLEDLITKYQINRKKTKILFGGRSAGGVGVIANIDHVRLLTHPAQVKGYVDSGWFTLFPNYGEEDDEKLLATGLPKFFDTLTELFDEQWNGFVDESCRRQMPRAAACLYGEIAIQYIETPVYVMTSFWDSYQITRMITKHFPLINIPPKRDKEVTYLSSFGNKTRSTLLRVFLTNGNGVFAPACFSHTFFTSCIEGALCGYPYVRIHSIRGRTAYDGLTQWFNTNGRLGSYMDKLTNEPSCNPSCCSENCYKCMVADQKIQKKAKTTEINHTISPKEGNSVVYHYSANEKLHPELTLLLMALISSRAYDR